MKKNLIVTLAMALVILNSCAGTTNKVPAASSEETSITTGSEIQREEATSETTATVTGDVTSAESTDDASEMPDQSFIGVWSADELKTNQILIWTITKDSVKFNTGVSGLFGFDATGVVSDGEIVFGDGVSPEYSGPDGVKGKLKFSEKSITVIYDDFGSVEGSEYYPNRYTFTLKDENSDAIVSQYKSTIPD